MKLNCKRIDFTYTPGEEILNALILHIHPARKSSTFPRNRDCPFSSM